MLKICTRCKLEKDKSEFYKDKSKSDGLSCWCKSCQKDYYNSKRDEKKQYYEQNKEKLIKYRKIYRQIHKEEIKLYQQNYDKINREKRLLRQKQYNESHKKEKQNYYYSVYREESLKKGKIYREQHKEELRKYNKIYREQHKEELKEYDKKRNQENKVNRCMSRGIWHSLRQNKSEQHWEDLVDYSIDELKKHLESQFDENMNWDNYGSYWEIDHIIPQNTFNFETAEDLQFKICWSLMNLRPLTITENRSRPKDGRDISEKFKQQILGQKF